MTTATTVDAVVAAFEAGGDTEAARNLMVQWLDMRAAAYDSDMLEWRADHVAETMAEAIGGIALGNAWWWVQQPGVDFGVVEASVRTIDTYTNLAEELRKARRESVAATFERLLAR